jgi:D-glycero-alpha-D-manno-heptose-7-phosphate kinase
LAKQKYNLQDNINKIKVMLKMVELSVSLKESLNKGNISDMGEILHAGWMYKKEMAKGITNDEIDYYYILAIKNGASGGKLLGAGGGGFLLFFVPDQNCKEKLINALHMLQKTDFTFENKGAVLL